MSADKKTIVMEYTKAWSSQDIERILSFFTEDCEFEDVPQKIVCHGKDELKPFLESTFKALPDFKAEIQRIVVADDVTTYEWIQSGTLKGAFGAIPPTGKAFIIKTATILDFRDNKIHRATDYFDLASSFKQVGLLNEDFIP